jgi:hypothetical protein
MFRVYFGRKVAAGGGGNKTIAADAGSYTITGTAVGVLHGWKIAAAAGSYAITGTDVTLRRGQKVAADAGSYAITGTNVSLLHTWKVAVAAGSYTITGTNVGLNKGQRIAADAGSYSITGTSVSLYHGWKVAAAAGSYAISGTNVSTLHAWKVAAGAGSYVITGTDVTLTKTVAGAFTIAADAGSYDITGSDASLLVARVIAGSPGSYSITGTAVTLTYAPLADERRGDPDFGGRVSRKERRARNRKARDQLQELLDSREEKPPAPTPRLIKRIQREIVAIAAGGLGAPQQAELARFVKREVVQAYQPDMEWAAITAAFQRLQQQAAEEAERLEIEDEDEFVLLMAA